MSVLVTNNAWGQLSIPISAVATTILLSGGQGERFPSATSGVSYFYATLIDSSNNIEIVKCTSRRADTLTVVRGADNTEPRAFPEGSRVEVRPCAALLNDKISEDQLEKAIKEATQELKSEDDRTYELLHSDIEGIKADYVSNADFERKTSDFVTKVELADGEYLPVTGGTLKGALKISSGTDTGLDVSGSDIVIKKTTKGGNLKAAGTITSEDGIFGQYFQSTSDIRKKENVKDFLPNEGAILASSLRPIWFNWIASGRHDVGLVAQEVQKVVPEVVCVGADGYLTINYPALVAVAFAAIHDLQKEIEELKCLES